MKGRLGFIFLLGVLALGPGAVARAALDEVQEKLLRQYDLPLRWDNVEGPPALAAGEVPQWRRDLGMHAVRLAPGEHLLLRVPQGEMLRLHGTDSPLPPGALDVFLSNGSGLFVEHPSLFSADGRSLVVIPPPGEPHLVRLTRPAGAAGELSFALFLSRRELLGEIAPYRRQVDLPGTPVRLRSREEGDIERFWRLQPGEPAAVPLSAPGRLAVETRLIYRKGEGEPRQSYWVLARLHTPSGVISRRLEFSTVADIFDPLLEGGRTQTFGEAETAYLELPAGVRKVELESTSDLYLRLLAQDEPDYLLPRFNAPPLRAAEVRGGGLSFLPEKDVSALGEPETVATLLDPETPGAAREQAARRLARDNGRREGGLLAAALMEEHAAGHPEEPRAGRLAGRFAGHGTFYRDLLPVLRPSGEEQRFGWVLQRRLRDPGEADPEPLLGESHEQAYRDRLLGAYFIPVPRPGEGGAGREEKGTLKLLLEGDVLFDTDRSELRPEAREALEEFAGRLREGRPRSLRVVGHTDSRAGDAYNQALSERRARSVAAFLVRHGIDRGVITAEGRGEREPRSDNGTAEGMQRNRRVEVTVDFGPDFRLLPDGRQLYLLPAQAAPGRLRLVADPEGVDGPRELMVRIDNRPPRRLHFFPGSGLPSGEFRAAVPGTALERLEERHRGIDAGTLGGPFAVRQPPAPLLPAGVVELPLPPQAREVRLWRTDPGAGALRIALQYRTARPFRLTETAYLAVADRLGPLPLEALVREPGEGGTADPLSWERENHFLFLRRWIASRDRAFRAPVAPSFPAEPPPAPPSSARELAARAQAREESGEPIAALEDWGEVLRRSPPSDELHGRARLARIRLLRGLGEEYLAENLLREAILDERNPSLQEEAFAALREEYRRSDDGEGILSLLAVRFRQKPESGRLRDLAVALVEEGEEELALAAGLALPGAEQPLEALLQGARHLRWGEIFERLASRLESPERRGYWTGWRRIEEGDYPGARADWAKGEAGKELLSALERGLKIHGRLLASDRQSREEALAEWEEWERSHPGARRWREAGYAVRECAGGASLHSGELDRYQQAFRTLPGRPARLLVYGPATLRLEIRPQHDPSGRPLTGWADVRTVDGLDPVPINGNRPSLGLRVVGDDTLLVGTKIVREVTVGAGVQEIAVGSADFPLVVRPFLSRPALRLPVLPPLEGETALAALRGELHRQNDEARGGRIADFLSPQARAELAAVRERLHPEQGASRTVGKLVAEGKIDEAIEAADGGGEESVRRRMELLVLLGEEEPERRPEALARAEALAAAHPDVRGLAPLLQRLSRGSRWERVETVVSSAGLRYLPAAEEPESSVRTQAALRRPLAEGEHLLGGDQLVLSLLNLQATELQIELFAEEAISIPPAPMTALIRLDGGPPRRVELTPANGRETVRLSVPSGRHALRLSLDDPMVHQFLRVRVRERGAKGWGVISPEVERQWQVATAAEPLRLFALGPGEVRIDERVGAKTIQSYRSVGPGWRQIVLSPPAGRQEALYRVYRKTVGAARPPSRPRPLPTPGSPVPPPLLTLTAGEPKGVELEDRFPLGGQEDGTLTLYGSLERRRSFEEVRSDVDDFFEFGAIHRYFAQEHRTWFESQLLVRLRKEGGEVLGVRERIFHLLPASPFTLSADGSLFLQRPDGFLAGDPSEVEWGASLQGTVSMRGNLGPRSWHVPSLSVFGRWMSLDGASADIREELDSDVFTRYKADHRWGVRLRETFYHRPWLDTLWFAGAGVTSNEEIVLPDHVFVRGGWNQLVGDFVTGIDYRGTFYFDDGDREGESVRHRLGFELGWERWFALQRRLELRIRLEQELGDRSETLGLLSVLLHGGNGRGYRDFWPGDLDFADLRRRRASVGENNDLKEIR